MRKVAAIALLAGTMLPASALAQATSSPDQSSADPPAAAAQNVPEADIIVTAQRRDESLSKTPVSVAVVSADALAKAQVVSEQDLRTATPGLTIRSGLSSNQQNYALRGQSQDPFSNTRPGVLPYINEVQIGGTGGSSAFYDLQSVQVLKGPQGTLFGRSATGGAVLFTTAKPTDTLGGYVSGSYGNYDAKKFEGAISGPIAGDALTARLAGFYQDRDGFQRNLFNGQRVGGLKRYGGRFSLTADVGPVRNEFVADYLRSDSQSAVSVIAGLMPFTGGAEPPFIPIQFLYAGTATPAATITGQCTLSAFIGAPCGAAQGPAPAAAAFYNAYFGNPSHPAAGVAAVLAAQNARGPYVVSTDGPNIYNAKNWIVTNSTTFELSDTTRIKNIFGYTHLRQNTASDADGTPYGISGSDFPPAAGLDALTTQTSAELQLLGGTTRLDYVVGFYFSHERLNQPTRSAYFDLIFGGQHVNNAFRTTSTTYAGYGQATYRLNDTGLAATVGGRYTSEKVRQVTLPTDSTRIALGEPAPPGFSYDQSKTYGRISWTFGLQDQIDPDLLIYAVSRRAYKSGGFNGIVAPKIGGADVAGNGFKAERVSDAEVGGKYRGRAGTIPFRAGIAAYYSWDRDAQRTAYTLVGANPATLTVNVPTTHIYGIESDAAITPARWLDLGFTANYTHAKFGSTPVLTNGVTQLFDQVPDTPRFSGSLFANATVPVSGELSAILHGDVYRQSKTVTATRSLDGAGTTIAAYTLANFRAGVQNDKAGWSLVANLKNAFNRTYYTGGLPVGEIFQINLLSPGDRRTITVEARFKF